MRPQHRARRWAGPALGAEELPALAGCAPCLLLVRQVAGLGLSGRGKLR